MEITEEFLNFFGKNVLDGPYRGKLKVAEVAVLIQKIEENAIELCQDAQSLFDQEVCQKLFACCPGIRGNGKDPYCNGSIASAGSEIIKPHLGLIS